MFRFSAHARERLSGRGIREDAAQTVIQYGRCFHRFGAEIYVIGRKEIERGRRDGFDLSRQAGICVVCTPSGTILTVYRNQDLHLLRRHRRYRRSVEPVEVRKNEGSSNILRYRQPRPPPFPRGA